MGKNYMGIDPGKRGGIAVITEYPNESLVLYKMPLVQKELDLPGIIQIFDNTKPDFVCLEFVHNLPIASKKSSFEFGKMTGLIEGIIASKKIPYCKVPSQVWQKEMFQGIEKSSVNTKATALLSVKKLYSSYDRIWDTYTDGEIDALLIAGYAKRKNF